MKVGGKDVMMPPPAIMLFYVPEKEICSAAEIPVEHPITGAPFKPTFTDPWNLRTTEFFCGRKGRWWQAKDATTPDVPTGE